MYDTDVLIAGGGPAGLATALHALRNGLSVVIAEPRATPIDKACGEGLMPGGLRALAALDVDPPGVAFQGIAYIRGPRRVEARFRGGPGRGVRRTALHTCLHAEAARHGAQWTTARIDTLHQDATGVTAAGIRARWMIGADGLHSRVRRLLGIEAVAGRPRRYGVRWHFPVEPWSDFVEVWWSDRGEAYVTPVAPGQVGVAILSSHPQPDLAWFPGLRDLIHARLTQAHLAAQGTAFAGGAQAGPGSSGSAFAGDAQAGPGSSGSAFAGGAQAGPGSSGSAFAGGAQAGPGSSGSDLAGDAQAGPGSSGSAFAGGAQGAVSAGGPARGAGPLRQVVSRRVEGRVLLVGDAAGYEDALTGEGISLAVKQAGAAIGALLAGRPEAYETEWRRLTRDYRLLTRALVLSTRSGAGRRAIVPLSAAAPAIFRGVVNILAR